MAGTNSRVEKWQTWGIATALFNLLIMEKEIYTTDDIMTIARCYGVEDQLIQRLSYELTDDEMSIDDYL